MLYLLNNVCLLIMVWSLVFILVQQELIYIVFSLLIFVVFAAGLLTSYQLEFLALIVVIIYVGVIAVLFLFVIIIYNLPRLHIKLNMSVVGVIVCIPLFFEMEDTFAGVMQNTDVFCIASFINNYSDAIILVGVLLLSSMFCSLNLVKLISVQVQK